MKLRDLAALASEVFERPPPLLVDPWVFATVVRPLAWLFVWGRTRDLLKRARAYEPYLTDVLPTFDTSRTSSALRPAGIEPPFVRDFARRMFEYARATDFGRRPANAPSPAADPGARSRG